MLVLLILLFTIHLPTNVSAQGPLTPSADAPSAPNKTRNATELDVDCNGILLTYNIDNMTRIRPFLKDNKTQPYGFGATASMRNSYTVTLRNYTLLIAFKHREIIVDIENGVLTEDYPLPYNTTLSNFTSFQGYPNPDLPTPIATAGDIKKIYSNISIIGTLFGSIHPMPTNLSLGDPSWDCSNMTVYTEYPNSTSVCCVPNPAQMPKEDIISTDGIYDRLIDPSEYKPRNAGNISITYDVMLTYPGSYLAQITIENKDLLTRLDDWELSWKWKRNEFIYNIKGAYTSETGSSECLFGPQGKFYKEMDFTNVSNCQRNPTILDLPPWRYNDSDVGRIPFCCRNGTIYPKIVNASAYKSAFQILVFKMPPDTDRFRLYAPDNFTITSKSSSSHKYTCSQPMRVSPSDFPDPSGLSLNSTAVASWQVTCNITNNLARKCCVSFSSYYNASIMPCRTCACGCPAQIDGPPCSKTTPAILMPQEALLLRYDNRTMKQLQWADKNRFTLPDPLPCGDYCGVNLNWHIVNQTARNDSYNARLTIMNWDSTNYANWYVAVQVNPLYVQYTGSAGYNTTTAGNGMIILMGNVNTSYLLGVNDDSHPGMHQGVIMFQESRGAELVSGDGNPVKVYFNGEECSMPEGILSDTPSWGHKMSANSVFGILLCLLVFSFLVIGL
ncbi:hypothetical protein LUZ60_003512 [Juncus effusus]|nr:hypothetical protein LUZ60_003512 [Juncus effusus]